MARRFRNKRKSTNNGSTHRSSQLMVKRGHGMMVPMIIKSLKLPKNISRGQEKTRSRFIAQLDAGNMNSSDDDLTDRLNKVQLQ